MQVEYFQEPWPYIVIDGFYPDDVFEKIKQGAKTAYDSYDLKIVDRNKCEVPKEVHSLDTHDYQSFFERLNKERPDISDFNSGKYSFELERWFNFIIPKEDKGFEYPLHFEHPSKIMSVVVYVAPDEGTGTLIYTKDKEFFTEIEWKPNRALIFSGIRGITWHGYKCEPRHKYRLTYNTFLRKSRNRD